MVTCQSSELGWEVTVELPTDFLSLERGSVIIYHHNKGVTVFGEYVITLLFYFLDNLCINIFI